MKKINDPYIGYRFSILRELLLLTAEEINCLTKIPITNLRRIEKGRISSYKEIETLAALYRVDLKHILDIEILLPTWKELRRKGLSALRNNSFYVNAINKAPYPKKAVTFRMANSSFLNDYRTVTNVNDKLWSLYRWSYDNSGIDYALNTLVDEGILDKLEQDGQPNKFRKTRSVPKQIWSIPDRITTELEEITVAKNADSLTPAHHKMAGMLYSLRRGPKTGQEIFSMVLYSYSPKNIDRSLNILKGLNLIWQTEEHVNSSKQKYKLTDKGQELLRKLGITVSE